MSASLHDPFCQLQVLGENAVLMRAVLEAVGVFAGVLGPRFASSGVILRKVLLVMLERLADPCPSVGASAAAALGAVCLHCEYPSRQALLAANADYLVDGLCRQLRSLQSHPRCVLGAWCLLNKKLHPNVLLYIMMDMTQKLRVVCVCVK